MKVKNLNSSSKKTKKLIKETFAILLKEKKELKNITVTELVKKADITRSTFYTHYDNIYEVAQGFQDEALDLLSQNTENINSLNDINNYFDYIINYLKENEEIYKNVLSSDEPLLFTNRLNKLINKKLQDTINNQSPKNTAMNISFFTDGCLNLIIKHFRGEINNSLDEINEYMKKMFKLVFYQ